MHEAQFTIAAAVPTTSRRTTSAPQERGQQQQPAIVHPQSAHDELTAIKRRIDDLIHENEVDDMQCMISSEVRAS